LGHALADDQVSFVLLAVTLGFAVFMGLAARIYFSSTRGLVTRAIRDNELRVEYMGGSVSQTMAINFAMAAFLGGMGGALAVMALGHIDPNFSYWTTSGEFVFVAILAGSQSVLAVMLSSVLLEVVRSFSSSYFPTTWQFALGLFLLLVIRFLPQGLGSLWQNALGSSKKPGGQA
jgi:branched-chain amino acid transport system permease protein